MKELVISCRVSLFSSNRRAMISLETLRISQSLECLTKRSRDIRFDFSHAHAVFDARNRCFLHCWNTHNGAQERNSRKDVHNWEVVLDGFDIFIHVFVFCNPSKWLAQGQTCDDIQRKKLSDLCKVHGFQDRSEGQVLSPDKMDETPHPLIDICRSMLAWIGIATPPLPSRTELEMKHFSLLLCSQSLARLKVSFLVLGPSLILGLTKSIQ